MSDFKEEEKLKIAPSEQGLDANIENWLETLTTVAKSKFGNYMQVLFELKRSLRSGQKS